jgi:hypothetical protein
MRWIAWLEQACCRHAGLMTKNDATTRTIKVWCPKCGWSSCGISIDAHLRVSNDSEPNRGKVVPFLPQQRRG